MLFNSIEFIVFFIIIFALSLLIRGRLRWVLLLVASYYFYMSWRAEYILLILFSTVVDYIVSRLIAQTDKINKKRFLLAISLSINLGLLFYFKYLMFVAESSNTLLSLIGVDGRIQIPALILPVGISFYTFQTLSYTIDVYRGKIKPEQNPIVFALFVSFFPQLVAGPIERSGDLLPQLRVFSQKYLLNADEISDGLRLITWGMFKKLVIADRLALYVNPIYNDPTSYRGMSLILATAFFAFQIYCDFSAYSDIAIGVAKILGIKLSQNFNAPYLAHSIPDFWRRWHISLSTWFRDYLYIPLGGNRVSGWRWHLNIITVFTVSGLWHGANWTFVIWGSLHGIMHLVSHYLSQIKNPLDPKLNWIFVPLQMALTFICVCFAWIFFRANSFGDAMIIIQNIFSFGDEWKYHWFAINVASDKFNITLCLASILIVQTVDIILEYIPVHLLMSKELWSLRLFFYVLLVFALSLFGMFGGSQEFAYFQF